MVEIHVNSETGDDFSGDGTKESPYKTTLKGVHMLSGDSDRLWLKGTFFDGLKLGGIKFKELVVEGQDSLLFAYDGVPETFNPLAMPDRTWGILSVSDCHNVHVKNLEVWGGAMECVHLDDSYPMTGLKNVTLEGVTARYGQARGFFMGGHNIDLITLRKCRAIETCYGDTTHGIYLSGGHWNGTYGPITRITLDRCEASYSGGRHGIQINGRFKDVVINECKSWHNQRTSLSLIGCQDVLVEGCQFWGNNDQGMVIYDYFDYTNFDPSDPEPFKACHHPTKDVTVSNCTIVVGYQRWKKDEWHYHNPVNKPAVLINTNMGSIYKDFRPSNIRLIDNILYTPFSNLIEYGHSYDASATKVMGNIAHAAQNTPEVRVTGKHTYGLDQLQSMAPSHYHSNTIQDPKFAKNPEYAYIDLVAQGPFNFAHHSSHAHLYSKIGFEDSKGAPVPHPKIHVAEKPIHGQEQAGETPSLPWEEREPSPGDSGERGDPFPPQ